jgi:large repetitive protein
MTLALLVAGCGDKPSSGDSGGDTAVEDADGDGFTADDDCDDGDASVYPGATEVCDGRDNNCDDEIDEDVETTFYADADEDGYGNAENPIDDCSMPSGYVSDARDCDDGDVNIHPGAAEVCNDADDNCDGAIDEGVSTTYYADYDGDGYGDVTDTRDACGTAPSGFTTDSDDCDDTNADINPAADEICDEIDNNCSGDIDLDDPLLDRSVTTTYYVDLDGDGFGDPGASGEYTCGGISGYVLDDTDCDDSDSAINPHAAESWYDGIDQDCDGLSDYDSDYDGEDSDSYGGLDCDDSDSAINTGASETWYDGVDQNCDSLSDYDQDGDGYDSDAYSGLDCDDTDYDVSPIGTETWYDGIDGDCDGASDYDQDGDGYDTDVYGGTDCDDEDALVNTDATEIWYDGIDQDCDGGSDYDQDGDGESLEGYGDYDCDDMDASIYTGATDTWYDGVDSNCDGASDYDADADGFDHDSYGGDDCDDTDSAVNTGATDTWYDGVDSNCDGASDYDQDADGYDSDAYGGSDCDDRNSSISPAATETAGDEIDSDCDGGEICLVDADGDGYTDGISTVTSSDDDCADSGEGSASDPTGDCDDADASINPGETETCDGTDNNCSGDESDAPGTATFYADYDGDGYGDSSASTTACTVPSGYVTDDTDCNDEVDFVNPGESANPYSTWDADCDGVWDKANEAVTTTGGPFIFDSSSNNLFGDPDRDSTFESGYTSWTSYVGSTTVGGVVDMTYVTYPSSEIYPSLELPNPSIGVGIVNEAFISPTFPVVSGTDYAVCMVAVNDTPDNQGMRIFTQTDYDGGGSSIANVTVLAYSEQYVCGSWTALATANEAVVIAAGNWTGNPGYGTHIGVGAGAIIAGIE